MKKFILTLCLVAFGATVSAQEKPLNDTNPSKEVVATANKKACCGDTKAKTNCSKVDNTASTKTASKETAVAGVVKSEKSCCKDSKSTAVASAEDSAPVLAEKTEAVTNDKKSCCSQSSANSNCSSSGTK
jgi:hypothetical protein